MTRFVILALLSAAISVQVASAAAPTTGSSQGGVQLTPVLRVPFPYRGYLLDLPRAVHVTAGDIRLTENGIGIGDVSVSPLSASGLRFGVVLAVDASDSMKGTPYADALAAARTFVARRGSNELIGIVVFNRSVSVLRSLITSTSSLDRSLAHPPSVAYGTHIFDAIDASLAMLRGARASTGAIVLLTDGSDVGSKETLSGAVALAAHQHVRVFTVGLRSRSYDSVTLQRLASATNGSYVEAAGPQALAPIYATLSSRLAREYMVQYRSLAPPNTHVDVNISVAGIGSSVSSYTSPKPSELAPFHHSAVDRFLLSPWSLLLLALAVSGIAMYVVRRLFFRASSSVAQRVAAFTGAAAPVEVDHPAGTNRVQTPVLSRRTRGALAALDRELEIAEIRTTAIVAAGATAVGTVCSIIILAAISPVFAVLGLATPLIPRAYIHYRVRKVRDRFAEQLPSNLQVMASGLRAGHSFFAALASVVDQAEEPSKKELRRALSDEQLGVPIDEAIRRVAERMRNRDLEQVALVAELQRTTGGNVAEVLDVVVSTIRDRQDIRRMVRTLTAQGRMARWILTCLPIVTGLAFYLIQPNLVGPFYAAAVGQVVLLLATLALIGGSVVIRRIVEIEV